MLQAVAGAREAADDSIRREMPLKIRLTPMSVPIAQLELDRPVRPDQDPKQERDDGIDQHPAGSRPVTDVEIENKLERGFDQEKRCQHESKPGETGERLQK